jgi:long-chain acyl-CoA synthetase
MTFFDIAKGDPDRAAVIDSSGRVSSFAELAGRVHQITRGLRRLGLSAGSRVAAVVGNEQAYLELALATGQAGMYFTPINRRSSIEEIAYVVADLGAEIVVADSAVARECTSMLESHDVSVENRFSIGAVEAWSDYQNLGAGEADSEPQDRAAGALLLYTSGTSGRPKAVHRPLLEEPPRLSPTAIDHYSRMGIDPGPGVHLVACPLYHAAPGNFSLGTLNLGQTQVLMDRFDAERTLRLIERYAVTTTHLVPTMFHRMLRLAADVRAGYNLASLRSVVHGAAPCPLQVKRRMIEWLGPVVYEYYGATEGMISAVGPLEWLATPGTLGSPLSGVRVKVLDECRREVPANEVGTVYYTSAQTAFNYLGDEAKTKAGRDGEFITVGDLGHLDDEGRVYLRDRRTDLIISGGVNIYPAEVEARLLEHPDVADAAVLGEPDEEWGQRVVAYVEPIPSSLGDETLAARLVEHCQTGLAGFKRPRRIELRERLPRTESGKLRRRLIIAPSPQAGGQCPSPG